MADENETKGSNAAAGGADPFHPSKNDREASPEMRAANERNAVLQQQLDERAAREAQIKADEREAEGRRRQPKRQVKTRDENPPLMDLLRHSMHLDHRLGAEQAGEAEAPEQTRGPISSITPAGMEPNPGKKVEWKPGQ
jgi:hypothetical protein